VPRIHYLPDDCTHEATDRQSILKVSLAARIPHTHVCGGNARCSTCRVVVVEGLQNCTPRTPQERVLADRLHFGPAVRLSCQTQVRGDITVRRLVLDDEDIELVSQLRSGAPTELHAVGREMQVALLFTDIRGFTSMVDAVPAYDMVHILNRYFRAMERVVTRNGGHVNNYMGDGLMALFDLGDDPAEASTRCVRAGLEMLEALAAMNPYVETVTKRRIAMGIGAHVGEAVVGTVGVDTNRRMTVLGDCVNFCSRVESANKPAATSFLISEDMFYLVDGQFQFGKTARMELAGKVGQHTLYEVVGLR